MADVALIGLYQLENLKRQRVSYFCFDLSEQPVVNVPVLEGSRPVALATLLDQVQALGLALNAPIVLVDEDGSKSIEAAKLLEASSFINVFVVEGGSRSLIS